MKDGDWFYGTYGSRQEVDKWILSPYCVDSGVYGASLNPDDDSMPDPDALPLLSIGQCIQYLRDKLDDVAMSVIIPRAFQPQNLYRGKGVCVYWGTAVLPTEPINVLFEAIKAVEL